MKNFCSTLLLAFFSFSIFAQVQLDKQLQFTGTGNNARITGLDSVGAPSDATSVKAVQSGSFNYADATGSNNNFNLNLSPPVSAYQKGMVFNFVSNQTITGLSTLQVNSLAAITIKKYVNQNLTCGDIQNGQAVTVLYDGANFQATSMLSASIAIPTITGTTPGSHTGPGTVTLGATASAGTINWYAAPTGGSSLGTGTSFTTPHICTTTNYYVDATIGACTTSARTSVTATIAKVFQVDNGCSLDSGLVSYYQLADATDFFGPNSGTGNAVAYGSSYGKVGSGADFGNTNSYIATPLIQSNTDNWSMCAWVYLTSINNIGMAVFLGDINNNGYGMGIGNAANSVGSQFVGLAGGIQWIGSGYSFPTPNTWYFLVTVRSAGVWHFYVNAGATSNTPTVPVNAPVGSSYIGWGQPWAGGSGANAQWPGYVDEVGVWNRPLSTQEISDLYNGGTGQTMH